MIGVVYMIEGHKKESKGKKKIKGKQKINKSSCTCGACGVGTWNE
jgi:hypothetical protein